MEKKFIPVEQVMHESFLEIDGLANVRETLSLMRKTNSDIAIVKKRYEHDAFGIVLLSDIAKLVLAKDRAPERVNIYEIMSKPVISVESSLDVRYCARLFDRFGIAKAPVIDNGVIRGVVSYKELVLDGLCELID